MTARRVKEHKPVSAASCVIGAVKVTLFDVAYDERQVSHWGGINAKLLKRLRRRAKSWEKWPHLRVQV